MTLDRKRHYSKDDAPLREAWKRIRWTHPRSSTRILIDKAAHRVRQLAEAHANPMYSWSGGKDSLALQVVCERAGVRRCVMFQTRCEFPAFLRWVKRHGPEGLEVVRVNLDEEFLIKNPKWLFHDEDLWVRWDELRYREPFRDWRAGRPEVGIVFLGHRTQDDNTRITPDNNAYPLMGIRDTPIWNWTHEETMAAIHWSGLSLPPNYDFPNGWYDGPCSWPQVHAGNLSASWNRLWKLDPHLANRLHPAILERCKPLIRA